MPCICYTPKRFSPAREALIQRANAIIAEYTAEGYDLTLRQLYYQFVARGFIENKDTEYKRLGELVAEARLAGRVDWDAIVDRTRALRGNSHWGSPSQIIHSAARSYALDKWEGQSYRLEVWVEKEALAGVVERIARELDVNFFSCRGYVSLSEMHVAARRLLGYEETNQQPVILHLGDHDPSGVDMTRDIEDRLNHFGCYPIVRRLALNWEQIEEFNPPPNPAKLTDSRCEAYIEKYGHESWELDALDPRTLSDLIETAVLEYRSEDLWAEVEEREEREREGLENAAVMWRDVAAYLDSRRGGS